MEQENARLTTAKNLFLIYIGQMLMILLSIIVYTAISGAAHQAATVMMSLGYVLIQLFATRGLHRLGVSHEYSVAFFAVLLNALCWLLTLLGVSVYSFVQILSVVCEIGTVVYLCRGTKSVLRSIGQEGHMATPVWIAYLICAVLTCLAFYTPAANQAVQMVAQAGGMLTCLAFAVFLRRSARALVRNQGAAR